MRESYIKRQVINAAKGNGWLHRSVKWQGRIGAPDDFFAKDGRVVLAEFKRTKGEARISQDREHSKLRAAGIEVIRVNDIDEGIDFFA